jgi:hypothetical protein
MPWCCVGLLRGKVLITITITITKWPHQSEAPVGAAPPTRSQLRLQRQTQTHAKLNMAATSPPLSLASHVYQASPFRPALADRLTQPTASQAVYRLAQVLTVSPMEQLVISETKHNHRGVAAVQGCNEIFTVRAHNSMKHACWHYQTSY